MSVYAEVRNATVNSFKRNGKNLNVRAVAWNQSGKDSKGKNKYKQVPLSISIYDPDETIHLDKEDKISLTGVLNLDENPNVEMVNTKTGKKYKSMFPEVRAFADKVTIEGKGDRTSTKSNEQAKKIESKAVDAFPITDFDDDLPF